ncbi:MAG: L-fucose/L-arabinose isomerase family protein [bacterium]
MQSHSSTFRPVRLGFAPTRRDVFSREDSVRQKQILLDLLRKWDIDFVDLGFLNEDGLLYDPADAPEVANQFCAKGVDALFCPHCNFGTEEAAGKLAALTNLPLLLWGPRDAAPEPSGDRLRDTQCGLFATSKILRRLGVPFTYIVNSFPDAPVFERGLRNFLAASAVVREFRNLRIGQVGTRPAGFSTVICNEGELLERFGIEIIPKSLLEICNDAQSISDSNSNEVRQDVEEMKRRFGATSHSDEDLVRLAGFKFALLRWARKENLSAIALQCWSALQDALRISACAVDSQITALGIPVACETDIHGAVTAAMLHAALQGSSPTFFSDLTVRHPTNDNAELLWHCGVFPIELIAEGAQPKMTHHYILPTRCPGLSEFEIKGGDITIARFDGDHNEYSLFMGHMRGTEGPRTRGTYVWAEVDDWPRWEEHLIRGPYIHHVVGGHGKLAPILYEACRYIPGLSPDPIDPNEQEIQAYWRGADLI